MAERERVARMAEEDERIIDSVMSLTLTEGDKVNTDPFARKGDFVKSLGGTNPNFKRKVANELRKVNRSVDGETGTKSIEDQTQITGYDHFGVVSPPHSLESLAKLYAEGAGGSPHYAAVNAKVSNIVGLGYKLVESNKTKRAGESITDEAKLKRFRSRIDAAREDLKQVLEDLNDTDSLTEILIRVWTDYEAMGNGYIEVSRNRDGSIGYIGHINAQSIRVRRKRDGFVQISANRAQFFRNFGDTTTPNPIGNDDSPNELIHIKRYSPTSSWYGVPDIIAAQEAIAGNKFAANFNLDYFENKAVPRHLITLKGANLGPSAQADLLAFFETGLKGQNHRSLFIPLPSDDGNNKVEFDIKPVEAGTQDSSFNNYLKHNLAQILVAHRVPLSKVSTAEGASLATARDADKTFKEQVCQPQQNKAEKHVNRILKEFTDAFEFKLNEMTLTDANTQSQIDERMVKNGIWTTNEIRVRDGMPAIKGGDERVDLNAAAKLKQQAAEATTTRERDSVRSAAASDSAGESRQPKGDGRASP